MEHASWRYDCRTFLICIDSYENEVPVGHFSNPCQNECGSFSSMTQLLLKLEKSLDVENVPQAFQKVRTFYPMMHVWSEDSEYAVPTQGKTATFVVHVLFRRNASWQGTLTWLDEGRSQNFRSVLELIVLMNSALEGNAWMEAGAETMSPEECDEENQVQEVR